LFCIFEAYKLIDVMRHLLFVAAFAVAWSCGHSEKKKETTSLDAVAFMQKAKEANTEMLDVRTLEELMAGYVPGSRHLDINSTAFEMAFDFIDRSKTYLVFCASGIRSGRAAEALRAKGFASVFTLEGGLKANPGISTVAGQPLPESLTVTPGSEDDLQNWSYLRADGYDFAEITCATQVNGICLGYTLDFAKDEYGPDSVFQNFPEAQNWIITNFNRQNQ